MTCNEGKWSTIDDLSTFIISNTILIILFFIGLYLQIKVITEAKEDPVGTWKLDMCHSIVMIVFYSFRILFEISSYFVPILHMYTGKWFCYAALFLNLFGAISVITHSLSIAVYKYVFIVHHNMILHIGVNKASAVSYWINLIFPAALAISFMARPTVPSYSSIFKCLGMKSEKSSHHAEALIDKLSSFLFCGFEDFSNNNQGIFGYFMDIISIMGCFLTSMIILFIIANILEMFFYQRIFSFIKSNIDPARNELAAKCLSEWTNKENMRKWKVNAQVTAVTSILEIFGNVVQWSVWIFITKFAGYGTLIQSILLYFVLLPYAFLMNTDQNKNRIIDAGWKNVLKNVFGGVYQCCIMKAICSIFSPSKNIISNMLRQTNHIRLSDMTRNLLMRRTNRIKHKSELSIAVSVCNSKHMDDTAVGIFTISNEKLPETFIDVHTTNNVLCEDVQPCSSVKTINNVDVKIRQDEQGSESESNWREIRYDMLSDLLINIPDEHLYITHFKELLCFEDAVKKGEGILAIFTRRRIQEKRGTIKTGKNTLLKPNQLGSYIELQISQDIYSIDGIYNLEFYGDFQERIKSRKEMIDRLLKHYKNDEDTYNNCLEAFIDMEEQFVE